MGWYAEEFGSSHEGRAGVLLADGSEPGPVYLDTGSGADIHRSTDWQLYDGRFGPLAAYLRGACACGWRGERRYPVDWDEVDFDSEDDPAGPHDDWAAHMDEVESRTVPLPVELEELIERLSKGMAALTRDSPLAALRAVAELERTVERLGRRAAFTAQADDLSWATICTALGVSEKEARARLARYSRDY
ncbi:hypothetical protein [Streptomyces niveus]|uniref:hypothetical protein n=1 Tax=Streptomyces niveus TaxID=193462 RepID=UPI002E3561DB|nr:hypothetical protein [Streptomyces niveus]WTA62653.1 hypothetical protein OG211_31270 [Streptomyces niveus]